MPALNLASVVCALSLASVQEASSPELAFERPYFRFVHDAFRGTCASPRSSLPWSSVSAGKNALGITLIGSAQDERERSAGWSNRFSLESVDTVRVSLSYELVLSGASELTDRAELLMAVDGALQGPVHTDFLARLVGGVEDARTNGRQHVTFEVGPLAAGEHSVSFGIAARGLDDALAWASLSIEPPVLERVGRQTLSNESATTIPGLSFERFRRNIRDLARIGDRDAREESNMTAQEWLFVELQSFGYEVGHHSFTFGPESRRSIYVTREGALAPDRMYIVSAHLDGIGGGGAADDDASGCSLVLEMARLFARPDFECDISVRFVFWNGEEWDLAGSDKYVRDRALLQGMEDPAYPGSYPEPLWLGVVQHDMLLFDHGLPPGPLQSPLADIDIEYRFDAAEAQGGLALARALERGNLRFASEYPVEISDLMSSTDSVSFQDLTASVSVRENRRLAEIGMGSNPHWHQSSDVYGAYSEDDFRLGFDALKTTLGGVLEVCGGRFEVLGGIEKR